MPNQTEPQSVYALMANARDDAVLAEAFDGFAEAANTTWAEFVAMLEIEGVFDRLNDHDARGAASLVGVVLTGFGPQALRYRAEMERTKAGPPIGDREAFADALIRVCEIAEIPRVLRTELAEEDDDPWGRFMYAVGDVLEAWHNLPEPPELAILSPLYGALRTLMQRFSETDA